jgi:hypothetical protein
MMTLFAVPKAFHGHNAVIQRNAVASWTRLQPACEIILCGDDFGTEQAARDFGVKYLPDIARNDFGTPLIDSVFEQVEKTARYSLLCYVNADIILLESFIPAVRSIGFQEFLMVGQRWDLDVSEPIRYEAEEWEDDLKKLVDERGLLHPPTGIDYFVFPRQTQWSLPPFAVGRPGWDNWFICRARELGLPVVDATRAVTVVHQNHDYAHVKFAADKTTEGPEAIRNRELIGDWGRMFTIRDATHSLQARGPASPSLYASRNFRTVPVALLKQWKRFSFLCGASGRVLKRRFSAGVRA